MTDKPTHAIDLRAYIQHLNAQEMALARRLAVFYISSPLEAEALLHETPSLSTNASESALLAALAQQHIPLLEGYRFIPNKQGDGGQVRHDEAHGDGLAPQRLYARKVTHIVQFTVGVSPRQSGNSLSDNGGL